MVWHLLNYGLIRRYLDGSGGFVANAIMEGLSMTNVRLAEAFLQRARARLSALGGLRDEADFSDVFREARDILELCYRGMLRIIGIEVPRWLDVGDVLNENIGRLPTEVAAHRDRFIEIYRDLRRERQAAPGVERQHAQARRVAVGVEPARQRVRARAELELADRVRAQVALNERPADRPHGQAAQLHRSGPHGVHRPDGGGEALVERLHPVTA